MQIHTRLVEERERLGLTQTEMAKRGGVAFRTYCDYESGKSEPRASFFADASVHGLDVQYVVTGVRSASAMRPDEEMVLSGYRRLDEKGRAGVLALIGGMQQDKPMSNVRIKGEVGQYVEGDLTVTQPFTINMGRKKKKE